MLNRVEFIGHLGRDPDLNYSPAGKAYTRFSLAVDQGKEQPAMWLVVVCWDELAELMNNFLYKGALVYVEGGLKLRSYKDKNGVDKLAVDIVAGNIQLLSPAKRGSAEEEPAPEVHSSAKK